MPKKLDLTGRVYGRLLFIKRTTAGKHSKALFKCECGNEKEIVISVVISGKTTSCGCFRKESIFKHGLRTHPLYAVWLQMNYRCTCIRSVDYSNYGGRGVRVCHEWKKDFPCFYNWALSNGWHKGMSLDKNIKARRMGVDPLLYSPEFCSFVTQKENVQNIRTAKINILTAAEIRGSDKNTSELMKTYNVSRTTINTIRRNESWI